MNSDDLWQQILATPADEALKASFLAALEAEADERAKIFPLAAELEKFPPYYVQHADILRKYEESLAGWRARLAAAARWNAQVVFVRGWPIEITIAARDFVAHAADIVAAMPARHLNLKEVAATPAVLEVPQLAQMASLDCSHQPLSGAPIQKLAESSHLAALRWLDLSRADLTDADVEVLAATLKLRQLEHLDVSHNPCRDPVDAAAGCGIDGMSGYIVAESIHLPDFGREIETRHGKIQWLHALDNYMEKHPPRRYQF